MAPPRHVAPAALLLSACALLAAAAPASAAALAGTGSLSPHGCNAGDSIVVAAAETLPGVWAFEVQSFGICFQPVSDQGAGAWDPATGGCVLLLTHELCLEDPAPAEGLGGLPGTWYRLSLCHGVPVHCSNGNVTLAGA